MEEAGLAGLFIPGFFFVGLGIGIVLGMAAAGTAIGFGIGFITTALNPADSKLRRICPVRRLFPMITYIDPVLLNSYFFGNPLRLRSIARK
ncbi:MAG: hypothetical protein LUO93_12280 [Methanomicrobiales archaeon]|nr:hypothetical protein [Methanomicrobiales archaeon]